LTSSASLQRLWAAPWSTSRATCTAPRLSRAPLSPSERTLASDPHEAFAVLRSRHRERPPPLRLLRRSHATTKCGRRSASTASALANRPLPADVDPPPLPARSCSPLLNIASRLRCPRPSTAPPRLRLRRSVPLATALLHHGGEWCGAERK
jgi:hypothetical protein